MGCCCSCSSLSLCRLCGSRIHHSRSHPTTQPHYDPLAVLPITKTTIRTKYVKTYYKHTQKISILQLHHTAPHQHNTQHITNNNNKKITRAHNHKVRLILNSVQICSKPSIKIIITLVTTSCMRMPHCIGMISIMPLWAKRTPEIIMEHFRSTVCVDI